MPAAAPRVASSLRMRYRPFLALGRALSRLVLGTAVYRGGTTDVSLDLLDAWRALGGNVVDCGREYGESEAALGGWMRTRGCRAETVVMTKGAHPDEGRSRLTPDEIAADLAASLAALQTDYVDLYLLHRDDPGVAVGPIVEALNEHRRAGRIRAFGASNWTPGRLEEANRYAAAHGLEPFSCSSPALSLAAQNEPPWPGCVSAADAESRAWYERTQTPMFPWSAQAGGFFAGGPDESPTSARVYGSEANRERRCRARELGAVTGRSATQVALAWVLHRPFPTYPIIGPRTVAELEDSVSSLDLELGPADLAWLELG